MLHVSVPATSANCCVGFDCLGMSLSLYAHFYFEESDELVVCGCPAAYANADNLVLQAFRYACERKGYAMPSLKLTIDSPVPFARGLGSSSCCIAAGLAAANAWFSMGMDKEELLELATRLEGHPDNAAPALFGSMNACFMEGEQIRQVRFDCAPFACLAIIPPYEVSTREARKVLPASLPFAQAVAQVGHALVFEKAIEQGDEALLAACCKDHLHEPYRKELIPAYAEVRAMADAYGMPFWISGSGPTMLVLSMDRNALKDLQQQVQASLPSVTTLLLDMEKEGTVVRHD